MAETKRTRKTTAKKAATSKSSETSSRERRFKIPQRAIELQSNMLERQKAAFGRSFEFVSGLQERQEDVVNDLLGRTDLIPGEITELAKLWTETNRAMRESYRDSVDRSFDLAEQWVQGLA